MEYNFMFNGSFLFLVFMIRYLEINLFLVRVYRFGVFLVKFNKNVYIFYKEMFCMILIFVLRV